MLYRIFKKIYLIDNFKIYILIENDIVDSKQIMLNINKNKIFINNYKIIAKKIYCQRDKQYIHYIIRIY